MNTATHRKVKIFGIISLLSVVLIELVLDNILVTHVNLESRTFKWKVLILSTGILGFSVSWYYNRLFLFSKNELTHKKNRGIIPYFNKLKNILKTLIKNSVTGNFLDLLFVLFFLLHLTWVPDSIFDYVKGEYNILHPLIFISGLFIGVLFKPEISKKETLNPLVLFTGISSIDKRGKYPNTIFTILDTLVYERTKKEYDCREIEKIFVFIDSNIEILKTDDIDRLGVSSENWNQLLSKDFAKNEDRIDAIKNALGDMIFYITKRKIDLQVIECSYEKIQNAFDKISIEVNSLLFDKYKDEHLIFNLTPGNKNISIALALNSIQGKRRTCYIQQKEGSPLEVEELDVFKIKDIFSELTD